MPYQYKNSLFLIFLILIYTANAFSQISDKTTTYDQTINIICNLSDVNSQRVETRSVKQLLEQQIGGFRFHLIWDHENSQLLYKLADGQLKDFRPVINQMSTYLEDHPEQI